MQHIVIDIGEVFPGQEITRDAAGELKSAILDRIGELWTGCLILDLSRIRYIDSGGLGFLVTASKLMKSRAGDLKLYGCSPQVLSILDATRMSAVFEVLQELPPPDRPYVRHEKAPPDGGAAS